MTTDATAGTAEEINPVDDLASGTAEEIKRVDDNDWTELLTKALPALVGIVVGFLTAQTLPEVETILGSDFTAPFVFLGIFVAIIGFVVATLFANLALKKKDKERAIPIRVLFWVLAVLFFSGGVLSLAAVLSIRSQPAVSEPTPVDVELTVEGRAEYQLRAFDQARQLGLDNPKKLAEDCAKEIPRPVRVVAIGGTVPAPLVVIPGSAISAELPCPSIRMRVLGSRGVAIPVLDSAPEST